jgi:hypothetical protein
MPAGVPVCLERNRGLMVAGSEMPTSNQARASRLVAEALVEGHDRTVIAERARSMGLPRGLTDVLLAACPCKQDDDSVRSEIPSTQMMSSTSSRS